MIKVNCNYFDNKISLAKLIVVVLFRTNVFELDLQANDVVFCGRILMFLAHFFPLSERSGTCLSSLLV